LLISVLWLATIGVEAFGWEFKLKGEAEWRYRYISRTGPGDLFGNADMAQANPNGTSIGLAGPQNMAVRLEGYSSKGSDAAYAQQRLFLYPDIRVNRAVRLRGIFTLQGNVNANYAGGGANWVTNPHYSGWTMIDSRYLYSGTGMAVPVARAFWLTMNTPWGYLTIGRRPAGFGMGWFLHEEDSHARSLALVIPYGPLRLVVSQYLYGGYEGGTDPNDRRNARGTMYTIASAVDKNEAYNWNTAAALVYRAGNVDLGSLLYVLSRDGHHGRPQPGGTYQDDISASGTVQRFTAGQLPGTNLPIYLGDAKFYSGILYFKYRNHQFFLNTEYDFIKTDVARNGGRPLSGYAHAWAAEMGALLGPAKISLAHFYRSGHDRRGGALVLGPPYGGSFILGNLVYANDKYDKFLGAFLGAGDAPIRPYCLLLGLYGTGNNSYTTDGSCTYEDFLAYAARVDYAVAANLNVFASAILARRASNTESMQGDFTGTWNTASNPGNGDFGLYGPNVPDNDLGWEVNAGFDWGLLENITFRLRFAYWQPGKWFNWAYRDMTFSDPVNGDYGIVNPSRTISPLMALQCNLLCEF